MALWREVWLDSAVESTDVSLALAIVRCKRDVEVSPSMDYGTAVARLSRILR